tara:strand:- start:3160 stop:3522 length:363 start_codon:yes stop_codon:yes gene_type:complete
MKYPSNDKPKMETANSMTPRRTLLLEAAEIVENVRNLEYGEPSENMTRTAALMSAYFGTRTGSSFSAHDVAVFGIILKLGRIANDPTKRDNWLDVCGYASIGYECIEKGGTLAPPSKSQT